MAQVPQDLLDRLRRLEEEVARLSGRANIRPAMDQVLNGNLTIGSGGRLQVLDTDDSALMHAGKILPDYADGSIQRGIIWWRASGELAMAMYADGSDVTKTQKIDMWTRDGDQVVSVGPGHLLRPYIPWSFGGPMSTSSTSFVPLLSGAVQIQNPRVWVYCGSGATGGSCELRLMVNGVQVGPTGSTLLFTEDHSQAWGDTVTFELQGRCTGGATFMSIAWPAVVGHD